MADVAQGPGWWQASDGRWYPPELHPGAPAAPPGPPPEQPAWPVPGELGTRTRESHVGPMPPFPPGPAQQQVSAPPWAPSGEPAPTRHTGRYIAIAASALAVVLLGLFVVGTRKHDNDSTRSATSDVSAPTSASGVAGGPTVEAPASGISLTLPADWVGAPVENGVEGLGATLFPDDPDLADLVDSRAGALPRIVVLFGIDSAALKDRASFTANVNVLADATVPKSYTLAEAAKAEAKGIEQLGTVTDQSSVDLGANRAVRIEYEGKNAAFSGYAYIFKEAGQFWAVTYSFQGKSEANVAIADASAATFKVG
ncbi:MAG: hypothetical protein ACR2LQ_02365 [Acidimicrobiales bacterium]